MITAGSVQRDQEDLYFKQMDAFGIADIQTGGLNVPGVFRGNGDTFSLNSWVSILVLSVGLGIGFYLANRKK